MEKAWSNLASQVYKGGKRYKYKRDLTKALTTEWDAMGSNEGYRARLIAQAERACRKVLQNPSYRVYWD